MFFKLLEVRKPTPLHPHPPLSPPPCLPPAITPSTNPSLSPSLSTPAPPLAPPDTQGASSDNADVYADGDSSESNSYDDSLLGGNGMTSGVDISQWVEWEFRNNDSGVRVSRKLRVRQKNSALDARGSTPGFADDHDDGDYSEYISDDHFYSGGLTSIVEDSKSIDRDILNTKVGVDDHADFSGVDSFESDSDDHESLHYISRVTGMIDNSKPADQEKFRHTNADVFDHANNSADDSSDDADSSDFVPGERGSLHSSVVPSAIQSSKYADQEFRNTIADIFDPADNSADDFYEYVSDDHGSLFTMGKTGLTGNSKSIDPEFRDSNVGVRVSRNLRASQQISGPHAHGGGTPGNDADEYADSDSSDNSSDEDGFLYSSAMQSTIANAKSVDWEFRNNDRGVRVSPNLHAYHQSAGHDAEDSTPDNDADDQSDSYLSGAISDDHGLLYGIGVPGVVENSKSVDRKTRNNNNAGNIAGAFDGAEDSAAYFSNYISDDRSVFYRSGRIARVSDDLKSVDSEFRNDEHRVRVSRNLRGVQEKDGHVLR